MPTYKNPETGARKVLGGSNVPQKARGLESQGWVLVKPRGYNPWPQPVRDDFALLEGVSEDIAEALHDAGYARFDDLAAASDDDLLAVSGIGPGRLEKVRRGLALLPDVGVYFAENGLESVEAG